MFGADRCRYRNSVPAIMRQGYPLDAVIIDQKRADRFAGHAKNEALRMIGTIVGIALFLTICMWVFIVWSLWSDDSAARARGRTEGYNLTAAFTSELTKAFESISATLRVIDSNVREISPGAPDTKHLQATIDAVAGPDADVRVVGPDGGLIFSSSGSGAPQVDLTNQPHFIAHRNNPNAGLIVDPLPADAAGKTIEVSRGRETADGHFAGEVVLRLRPANLISLNREIDLGQRGVILIAGLDGMIRAGFDQNHPNGLFGVGIDLLGLPYPDHLDPGGSTTYTRQGRVDGVTRLITVRRLTDYPLRVLVGLDLDDVMGPTRSHIRLIERTGFGATILIVILTMLLSREVWRRTNREIELAYDRDRLVLAQAQIEADRARLAETNRQLQASKESEDVANQARSQFLAQMSHELRTPLHAIIGFSELIQDQAPAKPSSPPIAGYAADILSSGRHLLALINAILDISKVESGTATLRETDFQVADLARSSLMSIRAQAEARNIAIDLDLPEPLIQMRADWTRLLQVLINLLSNAVRFSPDNGRIAMGVKKTETHELVFAITDYGIGMTEAEIQIALEPFGQVDNTLSRSFQGTGLGLPLAKRFAELHGGRLQIDSIKGKGTTARVILSSERILRRDAAAF